jgi:uncharacterized membrane protein YccC
MKLPRPHDPAKLALRGGLRTALVLPIVFAITKLWWGEPRASVIAAFGTIALLVFADFGGPMRARIPAYLGTAVAGFALIPLATVCSRSTVAATLVMLVVAFLVLYAGIADGYVATAGPAVLLVFVVSLMIPAGADAIGPRLGGWALACAFAITAQLTLWPSRPQAPVRGAAARACRAMAACLRTTGDAHSEARASAREAVDAMERAFAATPYRPSGPSGPTAALAQLIDDLDGALPFSHPAPEDAAADPWPEHVAAVNAAAAAVLDGAAERLASDGAVAAPIDLYALDAASEAVGRSVTLLRAGGEVVGRPALREAFRLQVLAEAIWNLGRHALVVTGGDAPAQRDYEEEAAQMGALTGRRAELQTHASMESVWFRNAVRGALALAGAAFVGQVTDATNAYWIVLGTLSVLRSHALGTGTSIRDALLGTLAGLLVGGAIIWVIGDHTTLLWFLLPFVAFFVAYAPKAISFLAAQASFSLLLLTLLNIIHPVGWSTIGTVRLEDVAAGFGVSLLAGVLLWPRGAGAVVRAALRADYDASIAYLAGAVELLQHRGTLERGRALHREALEAHDILDTAFRQVLGERRAPTELGLDAFGTLVAGAARIRRTAHALTRAHELWREETPGDVCTTALAARAALDAETTAVAAWHRELAGAFERAAGPPDAQAHDVGLERQVLSWARDPAAVDADGARVVAWAGQHLEVLRRSEPRLAEATARWAERGATAHGS